MFQLVDDEAIDNAIVKHDFVKRYHHQGANLFTLDHNVYFIFAENIFCHQDKKAYLPYDTTVRTVAIPANPSNPPNLEFIDDD